MSTPGPTPTAKTIYVTRTGLPLSFKLEWPFRHATSGADFDVLHTVITLENSGGLRALVAVNLSATLREVLPSLEPKDTEGPVINALRKEVDHKQTEFVKSGKLVPLPFSSRHLQLQTQAVGFRQSDRRRDRTPDRAQSVLANASGGWRCVAGRPDRGALPRDHHRSHRGNRRRTGAGGTLPDGPTLRHCASSAYGSERPVRV